MICATSSAECPPKCKPRYSGTPQRYATDRPRRGGPHALCRGESVGQRPHNSLRSDRAEAPDGVPRQCVLTTEVEHSTVTQFDRQGDRMAEGVVADHQAVVVEVASTSGCVVD